MEEIEIKFLEVDMEALQVKLTKSGALFKADEVIEEWVFKKPQWSEFNGRVRIRKTPNKIDLAYKETTKSTSEGNLEIEFEVNDAKKAFEFIEKLGIPNVRHQQKRRISYEFKGCMVEINFWPKIPAYVEIEGDTKEKVLQIAKILKLDTKNYCDLDAKYIYSEIYGIDIDKIKELTL